MTFALPLDQIEAATLDALKTDRVREGRQLDYKETLPGGTDGDKREFLSDVTSFANAAGGDLIFGIRERREDGKPTGEVGHIVGLPSLNMDAEQLRLQAIIRDGVAPRMPPVSFREIRRDGAPSCLLLRVPRSWAGLHMITFTGWSRFYSRTSAGKYQLDVHEIRNGFLAAETAYERLRRFRAERVAQVLALETPAPMAEGPKLMLHAFPITVADEVWQRVVSMKETDRVNGLPVIGGTPSTWRFNLDGFVIHTLGTDLGRQCYTQLFRSGGIEAVSGRVLAKANDRGGFFPGGMEQRLIGALTRYQEFWQIVGVTPPVFVGLTLSGVKGWKALRDAYGGFDPEAGFDRDIVNPPEAMLVNFPAQADEVLRPLFDFVWCGGGWPGSPNYRNGRWVEPK